MKKCPFCAEEIQDDAVKCRFCGEFLKKKRWWKNCFIGCLICFVVSIILIILFSYFNFLLIKLIVYKIFFSPMQNLPPYHYPPFTGQGIEGALREFGEIFSQLWQRLRDFFNINQQGIQKLTF